MRVAIRADASLEIGSGHVMRCLTLATALQQRGAHCIFVCREHPGNLCDVLAQRGFEVCRLGLTSSGSPCANGSEPPVPVHAHWLGADWATDAAQTRSHLGVDMVDWLIVDHYALDARWEQVLRPACRKLMVIDDLADRAHDCDLLLDQNLGREAAHYAPHVPAACKVLAGPRYALLRPEFAEWRDYSLQRRTSPQLRNILITMGGVDRDNATEAVLRSLRHCALAPDCVITVVMGAHSPWLDNVRAAAEQMPWPTRVLVNVQNMAQVMADSDLAIGAAGSTAWERCCLGLPSVVVVLADNQRPGARALADKGMALLARADGAGTGIFVDTVLSGLTPENLAEMSRRGANVVDGQGLRRIFHMLFAEHPGGCRVRPAIADDEKLLLDWANDLDVRKNAFDPSPISAAGHSAWFASRLGAPQRCRIFVAQTSSGQDLGQARFELNARKEWEIDYSVAPGYRGRGLAALLLRQALCQFQQIFPEVTVIGRVKRSNQASQRVFESLDFDRLEIHGVDTIVYRLKPEGRFQKTIVIATPHSRNESLLTRLSYLLPNFDIAWIDKKDELTFDALTKLAPRYVFFPHWSWIIPAAVFEHFECVIFHMTDLPYGRGGSPLQNLIVRGHTQTKLSAIRCVAELDAGPVYAKESLELNGTAEEILRRANQLIEKLILTIVEDEPAPVPQIGEVVEFKRRRPEDGDISNLDSLDKVYDYIRMLDADGYPAAFLQTAQMRVEFREAKWRGTTLEAKVTIRSKPHE